MAPALHKTRYDVAELFSQNLGVEKEVVIEKQTKIARAVLREKFLQADIGVTGANFLVADSGAVVLVENEGNARLSTSAPKIHIAVAGIEKLIPARAGSGRVLEPAGPQRDRASRSRSTLRFCRDRAAPGEIDGPDEFYLVLLDNGRTKLLADPEKRQSLYCIRCGACLNHCPVYQQDRRAQLSLGLFRADRRDYHAAISRRDERPVASVCLQPVRRVRRGLSGQDRDSQTAIEAARGSHAAKQREGTDRGERLAFRVWAWVMTHPRIYLGLAAVAFEAGSAASASRPFAELGQPARAASTRPAKFPSMVGNDEGSAMTREGLSARERLFANVRSALRRAASQPLDQVAPLLRPPLCWSLDRTATSYTDLFVQNFETLAGKAFVVPDISARC